MTVSSKKITGIINVGFMEKHLYWIALGCNRVPNKVATEYICIQYVIELLCVLSVCFRQHTTTNPEEELWF